MELKPRPMPSQTLGGLMPPLSGFPYFANASQRPFEPRAVDLSAVNAWWLADASFLVYGSASFVENRFQESRLPSLGFGLQWLGDSGTRQAMVLSNDDSMVIVFRGTLVQVQNLLDIVDLTLLKNDDLWIDAQFLPEVNQAGGKVHGGFLNAFKELSGRLDEVIAARRPGQSLWLTGHSLGGALATLAAAHLGSKRVQGLYTYGCPRVGDAAFCRVLPTRSHFRFVHRDDCIPSMPPEVLGYVHGGVPHQVTGSPARKPLDDLLRATQDLATAFSGAFNRRELALSDLPFLVSGIADHMPVYYATLLWNELLNN